MALSKENKKRLKDLATEILYRVDVASDGCHNSRDWDDAEDNMSAPEGMSYDDWLTDAEDKLLVAIENS
jgi:hypothetical protein|tara:strand:+ start:610 stop:816 length:207 start_codon:yes stop_codon:yes gene_type:complete